MKYTGCTQEILKWVVLYPQNKQRENVDFLELGTFTVCLGGRFALKRQLADISETVQRYYKIKDPIIT